MLDAQTFAFVGLSAVLIMTPGPDTLLTLKNVVVGGKRMAHQTIWGVAVGTYLHATMSALGLSAILATSSEAYQVVKWAGAAYLIWLGIQSLRASVDAGPNELAQTQEAVDPELRTRGFEGFRQGFISNILNPKVAVFYLAVLPQFIHPEESVLGQSLFLASLYVIMGVLWLRAVVWVAGQAKGLLERATPKRIVSGIAGAVLVGFGIRLATDN